MPWLTGWTGSIGSIGRSHFMAPGDGKDVTTGSPARLAHLPYAPTDPGNHRATPGAPGGAPYSRTEYGRTRWARISNLRGREGVKNASVMSE